MRIEPEPDPYDYLLGHAHGVQRLLHAHAETHRRRKLVRIGSAVAAVLAAGTVMVAVRAGGTGGEGGSGGRASHLGAAAAPAERPGHWDTMHKGHERWADFLRLRKFCRPVPDAEQQEYDAAARAELARWPIDEIMHQSSPSGGLLRVMLTVITNSRAVEYAEFVEWVARWHDEPVTVERAVDCLDVLNQHPHGGGSEQTGGAVSGATGEDSSLDL